MVHLDTTGRRVDPRPHPSPPARPNPGVSTRPPARRSPTPPRPRRSGRPKPMPQPRMSAAGHSRPPRAWRAARCSRSMPTASTDVRTRPATRRPFASTRACSGRSRRSSPRREPRTDRTTARPCTGPSNRRIHCSAGASAQPSQPSTGSSFPSSQSSSPSTTPSPQAGSVGGSPDDAPVATASTVAPAVSPALVVGVASPVVPGATPVVSSPALSPGSARARTRRGRVNAQPSQPRQHSGSHSHRGCRRRQSRGSAPAIEQLKAGGQINRPRTRGRQATRCPGSVTNGLLLAEQLVGRAVDLRETIDMHVYEVDDVHPLHLGVDVARRDPAHRTDEGERGVGVADGRAEAPY